MTGRAQAPGGKTWATIPLVDDGDWRTRAACRLEDANRFTRDTKPRQSELDALAEICGGCPVTAECALFALQNNLCGFFAGIWIGATGTDVTPARKALRRLLPMSAMDHGTEAGARQHRRRSERPCPACQRGEARATYQRRHKDTP